MDEQPPVPEVVGPATDEEEEGEEVVDGLPVIAQVRAIERASLRPAVQVAAAAATGFLAGAATLALARRHAGRRVVRSASAPPVRLGDVPVVSSHTYLVDVYVLGRRPA